MTARSMTGKPTPRGQRSSFRDWRGFAVGAVAFGLMTGSATVEAESDRASTGPNEESVAVTSSNPFNFVAMLQDPEAGGEILLEAKLTFPPNATKDRKLPAMIFVHGAGGPRAHHRVWLDLMHEMGIATVYADHFAPRGKSSAVGDHTQLTGAAMVADVFHLLNALAVHPRIDAERIGIMGASKGGGVAMYAAWNSIRKTIAGRHEFAVHIPLYPTCVYWEKKDFSKNPIMLMIGEKDNWTGVRHCVESVREFREAGYDNMDVKVYPGAHHGFDSQRDIRAIGRAYSVAGCRFVNHADGRDFASGIYMDSAENKRKALTACAARGVTYGGDKAALAQAIKDVREILTKALLQ